VLNTSNSGPFGDSELSIFSVLHTLRSYVNSHSLLTAAADFAPVFDLNCQYNCHFISTKPSVSTIKNLKVIGPCSGTYPVPTANQNFSMAWSLWKISSVSSKLPMLLSTKAGIAKDTV
jgi:hypothetical protein